MLTQKDYCDYDTCVALKELGYKVPTSAYYIQNDTTLYFVSNPFRGGYVIDCFYSHNSLREGVVTSNYIDAPTMWEAQKWLRENHNIHISTKPYPNEGGLMWMFEIRRFSPYLVSVIVNKTGFYDSEEALLEGIKATVKILKEEKK